MIHDVGFNLQDNNYSWWNTFPGWKQCFTTSSWMFMSFYSKLIDVFDDAKLAQYLDDVEDGVGKPGIAEVVKQKYNWIKGNTSYWWLVQQAGITKWLNAYNVSGKAIFTNGGNYNDLNTKLAQGPVIFQTSYLGGLPGGHIILLVGIEGDEYVVNDPFGNANTGYKDKNGEKVRYAKSVIYKVAGASPLYISWEA